MREEAIHIRYAQFRQNIVAFYCLIYETIIQQHGVGRIRRARCDTDADANPITGMGDIYVADWVWRF